MTMSKNVRTKLTSQKLIPEKQLAETNEDSNIGQKEGNPALSELDAEIECPRCNEIMVHHSKFDELIYLCDSCSFLLRCI